VSARTRLNAAVAQIVTSVVSFIQELVFLVTLTLVELAQFLIFSLAIFEPADDSIPDPVH
jgi:hypothetical protein